jgi:hypothetical protein
MVHTTHGLSIGLERAGREFFLKLNYTNDKFSSWRS